MATSASNWIVPLRRLVITRETLYRDVMWEWLEILAPHVVTRDDRPAPEPMPGLGDAMYVIAAWYNDPNDGPISEVRYRRAVSRLRRWWNLTFGGTVVTTSKTGETRAQTQVPNFHARLWKGPKRVLLEQAAGDDQTQLDQLRPYQLQGGRLALVPDDLGKPKPIKLYPGDVLEMPLHTFLVACEQQRFSSLEFDPLGSFYLGTTVKCTSGTARAKQPQLHDNMLAMRYQLVHALNMATCYHSSPVYSSANEIHGERHAPEGAGVYARGMPYGGTPSANVLESKAEWQHHWLISQTNTNEPSKERPINVPTYPSLAIYQPGLPVTWGWVCSPYAIFLFNYLADAHMVKSGVVLTNEFRRLTLSTCILLSGSANTNAEQLQKIADFQADNGEDPLLLHSLQESDVRLPRSQTPLGDLCCYTLPAGRKTGPYHPFDDPGSARVHMLALPEYGVEETHDWNDLCPGAGVICVSSTDGHEFTLVKLYPADRVFTETLSLMADGRTDIRLPRAGRMSAYNPFSGEDVCFGEEILRNGHYFVTESTGRLPPSSYRGHCKTISLAEANVLKFGPTPANKAVLAMIDPEEKKKKKKKKKGKPEKINAETRRRLELQINDEGRGFRDKKVSSMIWIREGDEGSTDPRTLTNIYGAARAWIPILLKYCEAPKDAQKLLAKTDLFYGERAVPFPTILESAAGLPSYERVLEQLQNHRDYFRALGSDNATAYLDSLIAKETSSKQRGRLEWDRRLISKSPPDVDEEGNVVDEAKRARESYLAELPP